jgi:hypothetical protein
LKWTKRFRKRSHDAEPPERVNWGWLLFAVSLLGVIGFAYAYPRLTPVVRRDFDARVVEKYVAVRESQIGSATLPRLVVETADGRRFTVGVSGEQYEQARVGMWLFAPRRRVEALAGSARDGLARRRRGPEVRGTLRTND